MLRQESKRLEEVQDILLDDAAEATRLASCEELEPMYRLQWAARAQQAWRAVYLLQQALGGDAEWAQEKAGEAWRLIGQLRQLVQG